MSSFKMILVLFISLLFGEILAFASDSCNGGGSIRKFADGSHDWSTAWQRLELDPKNFRCLNYQNTLAYLDNNDPSAIGVDPLNYNQDYSSLCKHPHYGDPSTDGGCVQVGIRKSFNYSINLPTEQSISSNFGFEGIARLDTSIVQSIQTYGGSSAPIPVLHSRAPYMPIPYGLNYPADGDFSGPFYYVASRENIAGSSFYLPIYIGGKRNIVDVQLKYYNDENELLATVNAIENPVCPGNPYIPEMGNNGWCLRNMYGHGDVFHIRANPYENLGVDENGEPILWAYAGIVIDYNYFGGDSFEYPDGSTNPSISGITAGNELYYLTKLGRLELSGIPQIFYEPIYCNSDRSKIVQGIFRGATTRNEFTDISLRYENQNSSKSLAMIYDINATDIDRALSPTSSSSGNERITYSNQLNTETIFSSGEFACCQKLNTITTSSNRCCSGYSVSRELQDGNIVYVCRLPSRVDLNVYFNKFVSNEGRGDDVTETARLTDDDSIPETGEPKLRQSTTEKIRYLGYLFCKSGSVVEGGAFGNFVASPLISLVNFHGVSAPIENVKYYSIVDQSTDANRDQFAGEAVFNAGFRWNHHFYCE